MKGYSPTVKFLLVIAFVLIIMYLYRTRCDDYLDISSFMMKSSDNSESVEKFDQGESDKVSPKEESMNDKKENADTQNLSGINFLNTPRGDSYNFSSRSSKNQLYLNYRSEPDTGDAEPFPIFRSSLLG